MLLKIKDKFSLIYDILFSILVFTLTMSMAIPNITLGILILLYCVDRFYFKSRDNFKFRIGTSLGLLILLVFYLFTLTLINSKTSDYSIISRYLIFIIIPLLEHRTTRKNIIKFAFVVGVNVCVISSFYLILAYYFQNYHLPFGNNETVNEIILIERPYLGFICVIGSVLSLFLIQNLNKRNLYLKLYLLFCILSSIVLVVLISARMSMISIIVIGIYFLFILYKKQKIRIRHSWIYILFFSISFILLISQTSLASRFYITQSWEGTIKKMAIYEPRITIWECAYLIISENENYSDIFGLKSFEMVQEELTNCYSSIIENESKKEYYLNEGFNSHNQFIDFLLTGGSIGLILFLFFLFSILYKKNYVEDRFQISIIIIFLLFFSVENVLHRQLGCYLFCLLFLFIHKSNGRGETETSSLLFGK